MLVLVVKLHASLHYTLIKSYLRQFPSEYQARISKFHNWEDAQASLLGRFLIQYGVKILYNQAIYWDNLSYNVYGKPFLLKSGIFFNISHSGNYVVCAMTKDIEVGVDIEKIHKIDITDFRSQFSENEWIGLITSENMILEFYRLWTKKEAIAKLMGNGLSMPMRRIEVCNCNDRIESTKLALRKLLIHKGYQSYVAYKKTDVIKKINLVHLSKHQILSHLSAF